MIPTGTSLSSAIVHEYHRLMNVVRSLDTSARKLKSIEWTAGNASVNDIIAYLIGWGNLLIGWYQAGLRAEIPQMPGEGFFKWDYVGLAKHFYTKYQYDTTEQQDQAFESVVVKIIEIVEHESTTGNLDIKGMWGWQTLPSGAVWSLHKWITVNTVAPYKRATTAIKKFASK